MTTLRRATAAFATFATHFAYALPTVYIKGSKFFTSDGDQFYVKGLTYSGDINDFNFLTNAAQCEIDAKLIGELGANVVNIYAVDPTLNHDPCMAAFEKNGIYVTINMQSPQYQLNRNKPQWTIELRNALAKVIDGFQGYNNTLAFFVANEFVNSQDTSSIAPYAKALAADMKAYRDLMRYRQIPIGYSGADVESIRDQMQNYLSCGPLDSSVDFYGQNRYSWCGNSSMAKSGYDQMYDDAAGYDRPIFFSETGCLPPDNSDRDFADQVAILGRQMNDRFSGAMVYEWSNPDTPYGLVSYDNDAATGTPSLKGDYTRLKSQWATLDPTGVKASAYNPDGTVRACPSATSSGWLVAKNAALPTLGTSGFTAPTAPASTPDAANTGTGTGTDPTSSAGEHNANSSKKKNKSKTPVGAIAGGVLGGLVVLALVLVGVLLLLRRKRKQRDAQDAAGAEGTAYAPQEKAQQNGYYGPVLHEADGRETHHAAQELDPARGQIAPMPAAEVEEQRRNVEAPMRSGTRRGEGARENEGLLVQDGGAGVGGNGDARAPSPSPFVQRQRDMEMEWLESEEARLRDRRELLRRQNGGGT